jgi:hypothetical protein
VPDDQLSLAIGRRGQNVRLASQLVGWRLDITSETKVDELKDELRFFLRANIKEFALDDVEYMFKLGFHSAENIINADAIELTAIPGIEEEFAMRIQDACEDLLEARETNALWPAGGREAAMRSWWGTEAEAQATDEAAEASAEEMVVDEAALLDLDSDMLGTTPEKAATPAADTNTTASDEGTTGVTQ